MIKFSSNMTKRIIIKTITTLFLSILTCNITNYNNIAKAEVIDIQTQDKQFGEWRVFCESDLMMGISHCKIASKFYKNNSVISIEPTRKFFSQFFILIPQAQYGSFVKIRVDHNDLILSGNVDKKQFGMLSITDSQKQILFKQMKSGDFLFLRFNIEGEKKEVTVRINLNDFRSALTFINQKLNYDN